MNLMHPFLVLFADWFVKLFAFKTITRLKMSFKQIIMLAIAIAVFHFIHIKVLMLIAPLILPILMFSVFRPRWRWNQRLFNSILPFVIVDVFQRLSNLSEGINLILIDRVEDIWITLSIVFFILLFIPISWLVIKILRLDFTTFAGIFQFRISRIPLLTTTGVLMIYLLVVYPWLILGNSLQGGILIFKTENTEISIRLFEFYLYLFFSTLLYLNYKAKEYQELELQRSKDQQVLSLERYSQHVESLYSELRSFRHDYTNILTSLHISLTNNDLVGAKQVYDSVLLRSDEPFYSSKFNIANLANLDNTALKSVFSAKLMEADSKGITLTIEIPELIGIPDIELLDLVTIVSVFFDNAIESACQSEQPYLSVAYFKEETHTVLMIENSSVEERVNIKTIYGYGESTKGKNRGIGLSNVKTILAKYPNISLETQSFDYQFKQTLVI